MSEIVERVAKAIYRSLDADPRWANREDLTPEHPGWAMYVTQAYAAIAAMRDPTEAMLQIPEIAEWEYLDIRQSEVPALWRAMIDAALATD